MRDYKYIPELLPCGQFIDPYELFETDNPTLKKVVAAQKIFRNLSEKEFLRGLPEVMDIVCKHFGIDRNPNKRRNHVSKSAPKANTPILLSASAPSAI
ncbi:MAG: hypothetical protein WC419_05790 [Candidatus Omnitrophota bacterium]|jgi:hypothetical protein